MLIKLIAQNAVHTTIPEIIASVIDVVEIGTQSHPQLVVLGERREIRSIDGLGKTAPVWRMLAESGEDGKIYREVQSLMESPAISVPAIFAPVIPPIVITVSQSSRIDQIGDRIVIIITILRILQITAHLVEFVTVGIDMPDRGIGVFYGFAAIYNGLSVLIYRIAWQQPVFPRTILTVQRSEAHVLCLGFHSYQCEAQEKKI